MWKESYRLGVERIDRQHMELFRMTEELLQALKDNASPEACRKALGFLKDYVIYHFRDEEEYQASIGYSGIKEHKEEHRQFTQTVLDYEKRLEENGYALSTMKDLAGTLTAWLIYHVADTDQKIVAGRKAETPEKHFELSVNLFSDSVVDVMETMAGFDRSQIRLMGVEDHRIKGDVFIGIELTGDLKGRAIFAYSRELALNLVQTMTMMELEEIDELVKSALCELTNISCGSATVALTKRGIYCDIKPPVIYEQPFRENSFNGVFIDTGSGGLEVIVIVEQETALWVRKNKKPPARFPKELMPAVFR